MMTGQQAIRSIDRLLDRSQHRKLNDLESKIVLQIWEGSTYRSIANLLSYDLDYIKQIAAKLWKLLSKLLGENICKSNIRSVIERYREEIPSAQQLPWEFANLENSTLVANGSSKNISPINSTKICLQNSENWLIDDRLSTIAFVSLAATNNTPRSIEIDPTQEKIRDRQVRAELQSLIWQNLAEPVNPNILMNEILSVLKVKNPGENAINCLIVNCYL
jgi:uncharacterized protein YeeX (DUF496 family)